MQAFLKIVGISARQQMTYRTALVAGLFTNLFFGILRASLLIALYQGETSVNGMDVGGAITYVALSQAMIAYLTIFGNTEMGRTVSDGSIASDLIKPVHFILLWLGRDLGRSLVNFVVRGLFFIGLFSLFYTLYFPTGVGTWFLFVISLIFSWLLNFFWRMLVNLGAFWSPDIQGFARLAFGFSQLFSGFVLPLRLLPDWFSRLSNWTPFPGMMNHPMEIYLGIYSPSQLLGAFGHQLVWLFILVFLCLVLFRLGIRRLVIQGG